MMETASPIINNRGIPQARRYDDIQENLRITKI